MLASFGLNSVSNLKNYLDWILKIRCNALCSWRMVFLLVIWWWKKIFRSFMLCTEVNVIRRRNIKKKFPNKSSRSFKRNFCWIKIFKKCKFFFAYISEYFKSFRVKKLAILLLGGGVGLQGTFSDSARVSFWGTTIRLMPS